MNHIDRLFRRLAARGYFEVAPTTETFTTGTETDPDGRVWTLYDERPAVRVTWAPKGQGAPNGLVRFNPFCTRNVVRPTMEEALQVMVEATEPRRVWLDNRVSEHLVFKDECAAAAAVGDGLGRLLAWAV